MNLRDQTDTLQRLTEQLERCAHGCPGDYLTGDAEALARALQLVAASVRRLVHRRTLRHRKRQESARAERRARRAR